MTTKSIKAPVSVEKHRISNAVFAVLSAELFDKGASDQ
jgi:hypothetical protein